MLSNQKYQESIQSLKSQFKKVGGKPSDLLNKIRLLDEYYIIIDVLNGKEYNKQIIGKIIKFIKKANSDIIDIEYLLSFPSPVLKKVDIPSSIEEETILPEVRDFKPLVLSLEEDTDIPLPFNIGSRYGNWGRFQKHDPDKKRYIFKTGRGEKKYIDQDDERKIKLVKAMIGTEATNKRISFI
jgi:hypothetical protein